MPIRFFLPFLLLAFVTVKPVTAQEIRIQNGARVEVANSGVWDLQGATMDFGPAGTTNRLSETSKGRVTGGLLTADRS
jgi:hypothetical protein